MSDRARRPPKDWPPLIVAGTKPRWVIVRDIALTVLMWVLFAIMLETEFELFFGHYLERWGFGDFDTNANWREFFEALRPFLRTAYVLIVLLIVAAFLTLRRIKRARLLPEPEPLAIGEEARRVGMDEAELLAARDLRVVVVHIDADGRHRVKAHGQAATEARTD